MRLMMILLLFVTALPLAARDIGQPAPDIRFESAWHIAPTYTQLSQLRGTAVLLNFWATW